MVANPIAGTGVFLLGGVAAAVYLLPFRGVRGWAYETGWLVSVVAGWLVFPLVFWMKNSRPVARPRPVST